MAVDCSGCERMPDMYLYRHWLFCTLLLLSSFLIGSSSDLIQTRTEQRLNHLILDPDSGDIFVGAVNRLYKFDKDLSVLDDGIVTGPKWDHSACSYPFGGTTCHGYTGEVIHATLMDNYNKVLLLDQSNSNLLVCGSIFQGTCYVYNKDLTTNVSYTNDPEYFVAANSEESSTVAFINNNALYVGSTYSGSAGPPSSAEIRKEVPIVSSRHYSGRKIFKYTAEDDLDGSGTFIRLGGASRESYLISYVTGFGVGGYSYFLTTQKESVSGVNYISKIVQICESDVAFRSYVEIPLSCKDQNTQYNLVTSAVLTTAGKHLAQRLNIALTDQVLITTFVKSQTPSSNDNGQDSAICIYKIDDIRQKFTENLQRCFSGVQTNRGEQFGTTPTCTSSTGYIVPEDYCGEKEFNYPLAGESALMVSPSVTFPNQPALTAIAVEVVEEDHTVAFVGTANGHLKKVLLSSDTQSREYADMIIDEAASINKDLTISFDKKHVYSMTEYQIFKVPVEECSTKLTCADCLANSDPYCGWCSLENKCSNMKSCADHLELNRWQRDKAWCIRVVDFEPKQANIHLPETVSLNIASLPSQHSFRCVYRYKAVVSEVEATVANNDQTVQCLTPSDLAGLRIEQGQDHLNVTLSVKSVETEVSFLEVPFTLYSCSEHTTCSQCTVSSFPCHWCLYDNQCRDQSEACTENKGTITTGQQDKCPVLLMDTFLLPSGVKQDIQIKARNLPNNQEYTCKLYQDTAVVAETSAIYTQNTHSEEVVCQKLQYSFQGSAQYQLYNLRVHWNSDFQVDGIVNNVTVYDCKNIATDCTSCIVSPHPDYYCAWCQNGGCIYRESCAAPILDIDKCPQAEIRGVEPRSFAIDGGTVVTITGSNIGQKAADIISVRLADEYCNVTGYETSIKILCVTSRTDQTKSGHVSIEYMVKDKFLQEDIQLHYKNPKLHTIRPAGGPSSGQSIITITGEQLDTGKDITVLLGSTRCTVTKREDDHLECVKVVSEDIDAPKREDNIRVKFDSAERHLSGAYFMLYPDPTVESIEPLSTYRSGGRIVTIKGTYLNTSKNPTLTLTNEDWSSMHMACIKKSNSLECPYPPIHNNTVHRRRRQISRYRLSLDIDGVPCVQNISACISGQSDEVTDYPDPKYDVFNGTKILEGKTLTLTGKYLNLACDEDEVTVLIGDQRCKVDSLKLEKLLCTPPEDWHKQATSPIVVKVELGNLQFNLGKLEFKDPIDEIVWIISSAVGGGTLIFIIIIVIIVYKRRSADVERQNKKLQIQLDTLESNVRNECKQAFAELQTEVSDFTSDLNVIGIPFWDYKMYTFRVLFPGLKSHPVLQTGADVTINKFGSYEQGLHQFNQLLNSKQFLLIFIRTLEQQKNFSIRDKSIVASLLMIVLQDKMEYATEILKALLNELIDKSVEKKHPKLMLRRTESVVEKLLSNWLSLSMYTYLKKHAGKMLFMLFKAIKHQTEKGPVDVFTSESKYSLSEDRLLREKVEPKTLNLYVVLNDMKEPVAFRALDCDTVTQAKEKAIDAIYMNAPFSSRPSVHELDLEWRSGRSGHLPLQDEDVTTQVISGWKRVNSLAHYHIPDGATLVLVPTRNKNDMIRQVHGMIEITNSQSSLPPIVTVEEGTKVWHLVKHDDSQNVPRTQKVISEIFLTRLLATKGTLQQYIDDLFMTILRADHGLPPAVKYLFDFLDSAARRHNIIDSEVVHTWKSNSLPLRFWVNIIKNPEFIFDINKSNIVDSCLSVIAQTFMDSCSTAEHRLGKDSPSNKLLFAKDIPRFRGWVSKFYKSVQDMPPISDQEITRVMTEMSMTNLTDFNVAVALQDLYKYAMQYNFELLEALDDDPSAKRLHLANRFEQVQAVIEGTPLY